MPSKLLFSIFFCAFLIISSCTGGGVSDTEEVVGEDSSRKENRSSTRDSSSASHQGSMFSSGGIAISSLSNNPLTSLTVDRSRASDYAFKLKSKQKASENEQIDAMAAARIGGADTVEVLDHAKSLMALRIQGAKKSLPELAKLEIGLAAIQEKNIARTKVFLDPLLANTKNSLIKASIYNAYGVASLQVHQTTDAADYFKKSLRASPSYTPALFNLGFLALKFGHYAEAQKYLSKLQEDWYAQSALVSTDRHQDRNSRVGSLCSNLVRKKGSHKIILFNCGLFYFQNLGDKAKARALIEKATQQSGGESRWDETAFRILEQLH